MLAFTSPQAPPSAGRIDAEESNAAGLRVRGFTTAAALVCYITFRSRPQHTVLRSRRRLPAGLKRRREAERRPIDVDVQERTEERLFSSAPEASSGWSQNGSSSASLGCNQRWRYFRPKVKKTGLSDLPAMGGGIGKRWTGNGLALSTDETSSIKDVNRCCVVVVFRPSRRSTSRPNLQGVRPPLPS